jgi:hypothetical protein
MDQTQQGELNWRLSAHPITLLVFLGIRIGTWLLLPDLSGKKHFELTCVTDRCFADVPLWCAVH